MQAAKVYLSIALSTLGMVNNVGSYFSPHHETSVSGEACTAKPEARSLNVNESHSEHPHVNIATNKSDSHSDHLHIAKHKSDSHSQHPHAPEHAPGNHNGAQSADDPGRFVNLNHAQGGDGGSLRGSESAHKAGSSAEAGHFDAAKEGSHKEHKEVEHEDGDEPAEQEESEPSQDQKNSMVLKKDDPLLNPPNPLQKAPKAASSQYDKDSMLNGFDLHYESDPNSPYKVNRS